MIQTVVFTFSSETFDDAVQRQFCRPPDQTLVALSRHPQVNSLVAVDPWRSKLVDLYRGRGLQTSSREQLNGRVLVRVRPRRLRHHEPTRVDALKRAYAAYCRVIER